MNTLHLTPIRRVWHYTFYAICALIFSFLGLGALLLGVSFVYQRDWLNLRGQGDQPS